MVEVEWSGAVSSSYGLVWWGCQINRMKCKLFIMSSRGSYLSVCLVSVLLLLLLQCTQAVIGANRLDRSAPAEQEDTGAHSNLGAAGGGDADESRQQLGPTERKMKTLEEFLAQATRISVGQRHTARFDCEPGPVGGESLDSEASRKWPPLIWLRLNRTAQGDDIKLISLDSTLITADRRFRAQRLSGGRWQLSLDNVQPDDSHAYFLCQVAGLGGPCSAGSTGCPQQGFVGGALLTVLAPPQIIVQQTSASLVQAREFQPLSLHCRVASEPRSQLTWKRESANGSSLAIDFASTSAAGYKQRVNEEGQHLENQLLSVVSSELLLERFTRHQAGVYLCIASNGVQPGVSQRIRVRAVDCKSSGGLPESCEPPEVELAPNSRAPAQGRQQPVLPGQQQSPAGGRRVWRTQNHHHPPADKRGSRTRTAAESHESQGKATNQPQQRAESSSSGAVSRQHQQLLIWPPGSTTAPRGLAALVAPLLTCIITSLLGQLIHWSGSPL